MPRNASLVVVVVAVVVAAMLLACWPLLAPADAAPGAATDPAAPVGSPLANPAATATPSATATAAAAGSAREAATAGAATTGSLLVRVVWGDDKLPAPGLDVRVWQPGRDELFERRQGTTDAAGEVAFAELPPGNVYPQLEGGREAEHKRVTIVAGERTEVTLELEVGMHCAGRVVDTAGVPVADAEIVWADWGGGRAEAIARSAADGTFALRAMKTHCHIGARKAGYAPSSLRSFTASAGARVEFKIVLAAGGASLGGIVLDPAGQPVVGAVVRAGDPDQNNHKLPDGSSAMGPQREYVKTDAAGRFLFASVVAGPLPVAARAPGHAPWQGTVEVAAGRREELTIRLQPGATVFGTVRDENGKPLAKVEVTAGDWEDIGQRRVRTPADGTFRIEGLATGDLPLRAEADELGQVSATVVLAPGEQRRWDPVLSAGLQLRGRVVEADGKPVASVTIEAHLERGERGDHWWAFERSDAAGRFVLKNCKEGRTIRLAFKRSSVFPELAMAGVVPGPEELVVTLPKATQCWIQGTVLGPDGEVLPHVGISPWKRNSMSGTPAETADAKTGAFRFGPYPAGTYGLSLQADGLPRIVVPDRELADDETWDLGTLRFERGGTLAANAVASGVVGKLRARIHAADGRQLEDLQGDGPSWRSSPLPAGIHTLLVAGEGVAAAATEFEIRAGAETRIDLPVGPGPAVTLVCELPADAPQNSSIELLVRDARRIVWRGHAWYGDTRPETRLALAPGTYTVEASSGALRATSPLVVGNGAATATLTLRRP